MLKNAGTVALLIRGLWVRVPRGPQVNDHDYAYGISAGASVLALPLLLRARTLAHPADREETVPPTEASAGSAQQVDA
jgi:hypothetical protein